MGCVPENDQWRRFMTASGLDTDEMERKECWVRVQVFEEIEVIKTSENQERGDPVVSLRKFGSPIPRASAAAPMSTSGLDCRP